MLDTVLEVYRTHHIGFRLIACPTCGSLSALLAFVADDDSVCEEQISVVHDVAAAAGHFPVYVATSLPNLDEVARFRDKVALYRKVWPTGDAYVLTAAQWEQVASGLCERHTCAS